MVVKLTALVADTPLEQWPNELPPYLAQPWDCMSHTHSVYKLECALDSWWRTQQSITSRSIQTKVADDPAQHKSLMY